MGIELSFFYLIKSILLVSLHMHTVSLNSLLYPPPLMEEEVPFELEPIGSIEHSCKYIHTYIHIYIYTHTHTYIYIYIWWSSLAALKTVVNTYYMVPLVDSVNSSFSLKELSGIAQPKFMVEGKFWLVQSGLAEHLEQIALM